MFWRFHGQEAKFMWLTLRGILAAGNETSAILYQCTFYFSPKYWKTFATKYICRDEGKYLYKKDQLKLHRQNFIFVHLYLKICHFKVSLRSRHFDTMKISVSYSEPTQTTKMECLAKINNGF